MVEREYSAQFLSEYYYELDCLLIQTETADTHYKVIGIDYLATSDETINAYLKAMLLLDPTKFGLNLELPEAFETRVALASERVLAAFQTLMDFDKRVAYDAELFGWENEASKNTKPRRQRGVSKTRGSATKQKDANRRASERFDLSIPVEVTGYDEKASDWHEVVESIDLSRSGGCILLRRRVLVGNILYLRMPMPTVLRDHEYIDQVYGTYAIVRWIKPPRDGFTGELPPADFRERPWATFHISSWNGTERRAAPRERLSEAIEIEYFDESEQFIGKSPGFLEDVSTSGVRVCAPHSPLNADLIRVIRPKVSMSTFALVRNRFKGRDGYERLCAQLIG
jgi:hypothetical protein